jgi:hypothetical protein
MSMRLSRPALPIALALLSVLLSACQRPERQHDHVYTVNGQDIGAATYREITAHDGKVSFAGDDPVKRREALSLYDRYRERITFKNNAVMFYGKVYHGGFVNRGDMLEANLDTPFFKNGGIVFDRAKVRRMGYLSYIVQSSATYRCFVAYGAFGIGAEARPESSGDQEVTASVCYPASAKSEEALEQEMTALLSRAHFGS